MRKTETEIQTPIFAEIVLPDKDLAQVYILIDPRTGRVRYVGVTINPTSRLTNHLNAARFPFSARDIWVRELMNAGLSPRMVVIDRVSRKESRRFERLWVTRYRTAGADLCNGNGLHVEPFTVTRRGLSGEGYGRIGVKIIGPPSRNKSFIWPTAKEDQVSVTEALAQWLTERGVSGALPKIQSNAARLFGAEPSQPRKADR